MLHYCLGGCSAPSVCARRSRPVRGVRAGTWCCVSLLFPPSRPACSALRVAGRPIRVSLTLARWYAIPRGLCVPRARSGCSSGSPRVPFTCVCARAPAASAPPPPWVVWRAHLAPPRACTSEGGERAASPSLRFVGFYRFRTCFAAEHHKSAHSVGIACAQPACCCGYCWPLRTRNILRRA